LGESNNEVAGVGLVGCQLKPEFKRGFEDDDKNDVDVVDIAVEQV
jgi:hypothetical protein